MPHPPSVAVEQLAEHPDFCRLTELRGVQVDLRYAGANNFAGRPLYAGLDCAWLRREAAASLERAAAALALARPGWRLLVLDALRPHRVQQSIWVDLAGTPQAAYFADPALGSIHSYGMAVDVTLLSPHGQEAGKVQMGAGFDEMSELSHPELHEALLASGRLTREHVAERECLANAMLAGGFTGISNEWWHFNLGASAWVRQHLPRVF